MNNYPDVLNQENSRLKEEVLKYVSFWPYFLLLLVIFLIGSFIYLRYVTYEYETTALIEIIDEAQDSEMALPTELTIFNRSMINLENEINILNSFSIHSDVVKRLKSNVFLYNVGKIKTSLTHPDNWFDDYNLDFKINTDEIVLPKKFIINIS